MIWVAVGGRGTLTGAVLGALPGQLRQDLFYLRRARALLAVHARRPVHPGHAAVAARHRRHPQIRLRPPRRASRQRAEGGTVAPEQAAAKPRPTQPSRPSTRQQTTSALLYLDGISVSFDGFKALNEFSFMIEPGEMRAIIGPNGAGKTTMMDVITGKARPDSGDVFFEPGGFDLSKLDETEIAMLGIGRKFQKPTVFEMHTVEDNLQTGAQGRPQRAGDAAVGELDPAGDAHRHAARHHPPQTSFVLASPAACRTGKSNGWRLACCWRRSRNCCWSTSRSPA